MQTKQFVQSLLKWYDTNRRELPWRDTRDPYKIWLSEVILQQTRVNQGLPYYLQFVEKFPTVNDLANASEQEVLRVWQGLGYYSRARNLHACAQLVVKKYDKKFPTNYKNLLKLPGIGPYTAAAIASICFGEPVAVVDGNVFRVLSRVFGVYDEINSSKGKRTFDKLAQDLVSKNQPDTYNQAIMEFGATHCTPRNPDCLNCIFIDSCYAYKHNVQTELPVKGKKIKVRDRYFHYIVLYRGDRFYMQERTGKDIWKGLYDFPVVEDNRALEPDEVYGKWGYKNLASTDLVIRDESSDYKHILSHQRIHARFYLLDVTKTSGDDTRLRKDGGQFYDLDEITALPKPVLISRYLKEHIF